MTMFPLCIPLIQNMGLTIVIAQNKHQFRSIVYLIIAVANVIMTYISVPYFGIYGAAACSCIAYVIGQGIIMNIYYYKVTGLDIPLFWRNIFKMAIVPIIMTGACLFLNNFITINSWKIFLCGVVVFTLIYAILMYLFSFNQYERALFGGILKKVKHS